MFYLEKKVLVEWDIYLYRSIIFTNTYIILTMFKLLLINKTVLSIFSFYLSKKFKPDILGFIGWSSTTGSCHPVI